jgi:hypothetical protein
VAEGFSCEHDSEYRLKVGYITFTPTTDIESLRWQIRYIRKYKIPAKKLTYIYETHSEDELEEIEGVNNKIQKKDLADKESDSVYRYYCQYFRSAVLPLEKIRSLQKSSKSIDSELNRVFNSILTWINETSYDCFEELLYAEGEQTKQEVYKRYIDKIKDMIEKNQQVLSLCDMEKSEHKNKMYEYRLGRAINNPQLS